MERAACSFPSLVPRPFSSSWRSELKMLYTSEKSEKIDHINMAKTFILQDNNFGRTLVEQNYCSINDKINYAL